MINAQIYCTVQDVIDDLRLTGDEPGLFSRIQAASRFVNRRFGDFIPVLATRKYRGFKPDLHIDPLLSVTSISNDGVAVTDYELHPLNKHWENGPYTRLVMDYSWGEEVQVVGQWGKWTETESTGLIATQTDTASTLAVSDGSAFSPGMVLLLGSEQELIVGFGSTTTATSKLSGAVASTDEFVTVDNGTEFIQGEVIRVSTEDMFVRGISGNILWVMRGYNQTVKQAHLDDSAIGIYRAFSVVRGVNGSTAAAHNSVTVYKFVVPYDVNWLVRQIAGLMRSKAASGFAGKVGNAELGETFYFNEFPQQVKDISRNYRITQI
jgi:hypothetical protein